MSVLNDISKNATSGDIAEVQGSLYDRFFVLDDAIPLGELPSDSPAFGLSWIGEGHDWSGVSIAGWGTTISPSFYIRAAHNSNANGGACRFFLTNDRDESPLVHTRAQVEWEFGNDLWMGRFVSPIDPVQVTYPIYTAEDAQDLIGLELFIFGRSAAYPQFSGIPGVNQRVGRNVISSLVLASDDDDVSDDNSNFKFDFDTSKADITGPDGVGDGFVDGIDTFLMATHDYVNNPSLVASYFDGDIVSVGSSAQRVDVVDFDFALAEAGPTGGLGWDEACTRSGDSSGPSFTFVDGQPVLIGTHFRPGQDAYVGFDPAAITAQIATTTGGTERPCFVSFSRNYVLGGTGYQRGGTLEDHLGDLRVFGDVTGDYRLNNDDIIAMEAEIRAHQDAEANGSSLPYNWGFDLNNDNEISLGDLETLMIKGFKTSPADIVVQVSGPSEPNVPGPDGHSNTLGEGALIASNVGMTDPTYLDGDLNLDGEITVNGDMWVLVKYFNQERLLRLNLDFDSAGASAGVLDAADINALVAHMEIDPANPPVYNEAFDLTTGTVETNGTVVLDEQLAGVADGVVNQADLCYFFQDVLGTEFGDINLDGEANFSDFTPIISSDGQSGAGWAGGDLNFDGVTDSQDADVLTNIINSNQ